jgi:hypothetical protein
MGNHLIRLSELLIQNDKIPNKDIFKCIAEANESIKITSIRQITKQREGVY